MPRSFSRPAASDVSTRSRDGVDERLSRTCDFGVADVRAAGGARASQRGSSPWVRDRRQRKGVGVRAYALQGRAVHSPVDEAEPAAVEKVSQGPSACFSSSVVTARAAPSEGGRDWKVTHR